MRAPVVGIDIVGEREDRLGVAVVVLDGHLDNRPVLRLLDIDRFGVENRLVRVQQFNKGLDPPGIMKFPGFVDPFVGQDNPEPPIKEGQLPQAVAQGIQAVRLVRKDFPI